QRERGVHARTSCGDPVLLERTLCTSGRFRAAVFVFGYDHFDVDWAVSLNQREVRARDGTRIGYQVRGEGPCVVLANGLGGTYITFKHLYETLGDYKTICWDYRGLY